MGVDHYGRRAEKHAWESVEHSQIGHPSGCSSRSDCVLIKLDASIGERNIYLDVQWAEVYVWWSQIRVIVIFLFWFENIIFTLYIKYYIVSRNFTNAIHAYMKITLTTNRVAKADSTKNCLSKKCFVSNHDP